MIKRIMLCVLVISVLLVGSGCAAKQKPAAPAKPKAETPAVKKPADNRKLVKVKIKDFAFQPAEIKVGVNDIIDWENLDAAEHSVHADDDAWQSKPLGQGDHFEQSFSQPGTYSYHCHIHLTMKGKIIVE